MQELLRPAPTQILLVAARRKITITNTKQPTENTKQPTLRLYSLRKTVIQNDASVCQKGNAKNRSADLGFQCCFFIENC